MEKKENNLGNKKFFIGFVVCLLVCCLAIFGLYKANIIKFNGNNATTENNNVTENEEQKEGKESSEDSLELANSLLKRYFIDNCAGFNQVGNLQKTKGIEEMLDSHKKDNKTLTCKEFYDKVGIKYGNDGFPVGTDSFTVCDPEENEVTEIPANVMKEIYTTLYGNRSVETDYLYSGGVRLYQYNDKYYMVPTTSGGICGPDKIFYKVDKVIKDGDSLTIKLLYILLDDIDGAFDYFTEINGGKAVSYNNLKIQGLLFDKYGDKAKEANMLFKKDKDNYYLVGYDNYDIVSEY